MSASARRVRAEIGYTAYIAQTASKTRPLLFLFNGGPGAASAYLQLGAVGPWRIALNTTARQELLVNEQSWLGGFADLVFIDPPGTGFTSRSVDPRAWSVATDAALIADAIFQLTQRFGARGRLFYLVGESYGAFRAVHVAQRLKKEGVSLDGLVFISPVLDYVGALHPGIIRLALRASFPLSPRRSAKKLGRSRAPYWGTPRPLRAAILCVIFCWACVTKRLKRGSMIASPSSPVAAFCS